MSEERDLRDELGLHDPVASQHNKESDPHPFYNRTLLVLLVLAVIAAVGVTSLF